MQSEALRAAAIELIKRRAKLVTRIQEANAELASIDQALGGLKPFIGDDASEVDDTASASLPGAPTMKAAVVQVLRAAGGEPLPVAEIWNRVQGLGVRSRSKEPLNILDSTIGELRRNDEPIELLGKRTYRWIPGKPSAAVQRQFDPFGEAFGDALPSE
jgi:hypothetical protein